MHSSLPLRAVEVIDRIRARGMVPGLWLEPEVVGVTSPIATSLPNDAFFVRNGHRLIENDRFHLDLRHPAARAHLDEVVDRLVGNAGHRLLQARLQHQPGPGTDAGGPSLGLGPARAQPRPARLARRRRGRHPQLTLENCAAGGMRVDYAMLSRLQLQSTSDQQDYRRYPPIAAAAAMAIAPEQAASWSYPQPDFSDDAIAYTMSTGMLGRLYLSGHLDRMTPAQLALVREGVASVPSTCDRSSPARCRSGRSACRGGRTAGSVTACATRPRPSSRCGAANPAKDRVRLAHPGPSARSSCCTRGRPTHAPR